MAKRKLFMLPSEIELDPESLHDQNNHNTRGILTIVRLFGGVFSGHSVESRTLGKIGFTEGRGVPDFAPRYRSPSPRVIR